MPARILGDSFQKDLSVSMGSYGCTSKWWQMNCNPWPCISEKSFNAIGFPSQHALMRALFHLSASKSKHSLYTDMFESIGLLLLNQVWGVTVLCKGGLFLRLVSYLLGGWCPWGRCELLVVPLALLSTSKPLQTTSWLPGSITYSLTIPIKQLPKYYAAMLDFMLQPFVSRKSFPNLSKQPSQKDLGFHRETNNVKSQDLQTTFASIAKFCHLNWVSC